MVNTYKRCQLWRVDLIHLNGYHAPYQLIEVNTSKNEYNAAHKIVIGLKLRLLDFPDKWRFTLTKLDRVKIDGKWIET